LSDLHTVTDQPLPDQLTAYTQRILAFIIPRIPITTAENDTVRAAAVLQFQHEKSADAALDGTRLPDNVTAFKLGDFSMNFNGSTGGPLTSKTICPTAYATLLNAGLLYRGVY
jgi:hypothetical protein